jgi:hypothetical protein
MFEQPYLGRCGSQNGNAAMFMNITSSFSYKMHTILVCAQPGILRIIVPISFSWHSSAFNFIPRLIVWLQSSAKVNMSSSGIRLEILDCVRTYMR